MSTNQRSYSLGPLHSQDDIKRARKTILEEWPQSCKPLNRVDWASLHLEVATNVSKRSPDAQTKVGAVIVTPNNEPVSYGYNGFPRGIMDNTIPNVRPLKYDWIIHAEVNAILNAARLGISTKGTTMYLTHPPCSTCTLFMYQAGIAQVFFDNNNRNKINMLNNSEYGEWMAQFHLITGGNMKICGI